MARISVEQKALIDPRYKTLGRLLGESKYSALGRMIYVWNECQEVGSYTLEKSTIDDIFPEIPGFTNAVISSKLASKVRSGKIRIKGTKGRIEWLNKARANGRFGRLGKDFGKLGGAPPERPPQSGGRRTPVRGLVPNPPTAPAHKDIKEKHTKEKGPGKAGRRPGSVEEVIEYAKTRSGLIDPQDFFDKNEGIGWVDKNGNPYSDWKAVFRTWERYRKDSPKKGRPGELYALVGSADRVPEKTPEEEKFDKGECPKCGGEVGLITGKTFHDTGFGCRNCGYKKGGA